MLDAGLTDLLKPFQVLQLVVAACVGIATIYMIFNAERKRKAETEKAAASVPPIYQTETQIMMQGPLSVMIEAHRTNNTELRRIADLIQTDMTEKRLSREMLRELLDIVRENKDTVRENKDLLQRMVGLLERLVADPRRRA